MAAKTVPRRLPRVAVPGTTERSALIPEANELEYLTAGDQQTVDQVEVTSLPQLRDFPLPELPESVLVNAIKPLELQRFLLIQHDVQPDGGKQVQGERGRDEL